MTSDIERNLTAVREQIEDAAAHAGRNPKEITLVAVSKTFPAEAVIAANKIGVQHFGENRVEEASEKIPLVNQLRQEDRSATQPPKPIWHLIGHLQSRKVQPAVTLFDFIHSIDSVSLAAKLEQRAAALAKPLPILLEVNVSGEASKFGLAPEPREPFIAAVSEILALPHLDVQGLMTVAPIVEQPDQARVYFRSLRILRDELAARFPAHSWRHLSMGMTNDFQAAIAEGATIIRIGRAIFGDRTRQE